MLWEDHSEWSRAEAEAGNFFGIKSTRSLTTSFVNMAPSVRPEIGTSSSSCRIISTLRPIVFARSRGHAVEFRVNNWQPRCAPVAGEVERLEPSGEEGVDQILALLGVQDLRTNVNIPNAGQIPDFDRGVVVETYALMQKDRVAACRDLCRRAQQPRCAESWTHSR